ncbi:MAG: PIN domain-containing protein [Candidatus Bathyarchaeota archaeon]|nr:PIN domain-containing protein [Candidatus Bathyarchaeota archaeon]
MKILLDTNILVHAYNKSSPHQQEAANILKKALKGETKACLTPQILYELFMVVTNPKRVEKPLPIAEAADLCIDLWESNNIDKLNHSEVALLEVFKLVKKLKLDRAKIFDCVLAVIAKENNVKTIFTENIDYFKRYSFLKTHNPFER